METKKCRKPENLLGEAFQWIAAGLQMAETSIDAQTVNQWWGHLSPTTLFF
jgi:hypothetical protein